MYKITLVLLSVFCIHIGLKAQPVIDLHPRILEKEINRINGQTNQLAELTSSPEVERQIVPGKIYAVSELQKELPVKYVYVGRVKTCRSGGCAIETDSYANKESEFFDYFILYDSACTVQLVKIYNYQATHGQEVTAKSWLKQFIGYKGDTELNAGKNIDGISGATISVNAINFDIEYRTGLLKQAIRH